MSRRIRSHSHRLHLPLGAAGLIAAALIASAFLLVPAPTVAATPDTNRAQAAAGWLAGELEDGAVPGFAPGVPDWGLTVDALWAFAATGAGEPLGLSAAAVEAHVSDYATFDSFDVPGVRLAGPLAKSLLTAAVLGADPLDFGGYDLRAEVLALVASAPDPEQGRVRDIGAGADNSNTFSQSLTVLGLVRTGALPPDTVTYLLRQQCAAGHFRLFLDPLTCDDAAGPPDTDATALAVQALIAARDAGTAGLDGAVTRALDWLEAAQGADGSFGGGATTAAPNSNSTGVAAQALAAGGRAAPVARAAAWVAGLQVTAAVAVGPLAGEEGALAYAPADLAAARAGGLGPTRSVWQRSTPQAVFAFVPIPLGKLTVPAAPPEPTPTPTLTATPTPTPTSSPTPTVTSTPTPSATGTPTPTATPIPTTTSSPTPTATPSPGRTPGRQRGGQPADAAGTSGAAGAASASTEPAGTAPATPGETRFRNRAGSAGSIGANPADPPGGDRAGPDLAGPNAGDATAALPSGPDGAPLGVPWLAWAVGGGALSGAAVVGGQLLRTRRPR